MSRLDAVRFGSLPTEPDRTHHAKAPVELVLGTGLSHKVVLEEDWDFDLEVVPARVDLTPDEPSEDDGDWSLDDLICENDA